MIKRIFNLFLNIIFFLDKTVIYLTKRSILTKISDFTQEKSYKSLRSAHFQRHSEVHHESNGMATGDSTHNR